MLSATFSVDSSKHADKAPGWPASHNAPYLHPSPCIPSQLELATSFLRSTWVTYSDMIKLWDSAINDTFRDFYDRIMDFQTNGLNFRKLFSDFCRKREFWVEENASHSDTGKGDSNLKEKIHWGWTFLNWRWDKPADLGSF